MSDVSQVARKNPRIEGPVKTHRYGSVGFLLNSRKSPSLCRRAAYDMLSLFELHWVPNLRDNVAGMVAELVTNACRHAPRHSDYPAGSLTMWHPNHSLIITVHDKSPYIPYRETYRRIPNPGDMSWGVTEIDPDADAFASLAESGRGLSMVRALAEEHCGELDWARDGDTKMPGKVARVRLLLPNVQWPHTFQDPWS